MSATSCAGCPCLSETYSDFSCGLEYLIHYVVIEGNWVLLSYDCRLVKIVTQDETIERDKLELEAQE